MQPTGRVRVVTVNFNGGDLTLECLRALSSTDWPSELLEIVLVDNASSDGSVARVRAELPSVRIIESPVNRGFAGGCNLGLEGFETVEHVALVNNDVVVEPGWLAPLVEGFENDPELGATCPKILLVARYADVTITTPTHRRGRGDDRDLGVHVSGLRVATDDVWGRTLRVRGWWGLEPGPGGSLDGEWTREEAVLRVPVPEPLPPSCGFRLDSDVEKPVAIRSGEHETRFDVGPEPRWVDVALSGPARDVIHNVGSFLTNDGYGADRGFMEVDDGQYDDSTDVFAWCGAAVLLSSRYLADVGIFDERLFLYYEDLELALRGRERGWRYRLVPGSTIRHLHSATTGQRSLRFLYYNERNRLLVLTRHAPVRTVVKALGRQLLVTASYTRRDVLSSVLHGRGIHGAIPLTRLRALGGYLLRAPRFKRLLKR